MSIKYNNRNVGLTLPGSSEAEDITYDPTNSGLTATNVQDAIDEVVSDSIDYLTVVNGKICVIYEVTP